MKSWPRAWTKPRGPATMRWQRRCHERAEGDLRLVEGGFRHSIEQAGREEGPSWSFDPAALENALKSWNPHPPRPALAQSPARLRVPLGVAPGPGRVVSGTPRRPPARTLRQAGALAELLEHGYLEPAESNSIRLITHSLWREALLAKDRRAPRRSTSGCTSDTPRSRACRRRRVCLCPRAWLRRPRQGRPSGFRQRSPERADAEQRWRDVLRLLAYPSAPRPRTGRRKARGSGWRR